MCREKFFFALIILSKLGSPLRVQGKALVGANLHDFLRITPACAGKSFQDEAKRRISQDHPCVCREKFPKNCSCKPSLGSPLRVQGKVYAEFGDGTRERITPACAGKSYNRCGRPVLS